MRRIVVVAVFAGAGILVARSLVHKVNPHERLMAGCERMFEQMPEGFPPKRIMLGIEEIRANTTRTLELLEQRAGEAGPPGEHASGEEVVHAT